MSSEFAAIGKTLIHFSVRSKGPGTSETETRRGGGGGGGGSKAAMLQTSSVQICIHQKEHLFTNHDHFKNILDHSQAT